MDTFEINSETGAIKLNGKELESVNSIDLHVETGDTAKLAINLDTKVEKVKLVVSGDVEWYQKGNEEGSKDEKVEKTIDNLCKIVQKKTENCKESYEVNELTELTKALAELLTARAKLE